MKDITHYFQLPEKNVAEVSKAKETSVELSKEKPINENTSLAEKLIEKNNSNKKRREIDSSEVRKTKKPKLDDSLPSKENKDAKFSKRNDKKSITKDLKMIDSKFAKNDDTVQVKSEEKISCRKLNSKECGFLMLKAVVLEDCFKIQSPNTFVEQEDSKTESDSESVFCESKANNKKGNEKADDETSSNNLLNYFNKVDRTELQEKKNLSQTLITVKAVVHSPPKKNIPPKQSSEVIQCSPVIKSRKSKLKKSCNFDDIEVIATEIISVDETEAKTENNVEKQDLVKLTNSPKIQPWKMRVKLTTSSKLNIFSEKIENKPKKSKKSKKNVSDEEDVKKIKNSGKQLSNVLLENDDDVVITGILEPSPLIKSPSTPEKLVSVKLAPLFCKKYEKPKPKERVKDEAKRQFLESGVPEVIKKKMEEQKNTIEEEYRGEYTFPTCNHIQQKNLGSFIWNLEEIMNFKFKLAEKLNTNKIYSRSYLFVKSNLESQHCEEFSLYSFDIKTEITALKKQEPNVNVGDMHSVVKRLNKVSENINNVICWSEKYNPTHFDDMVGNKNSLLKLKEWIENHKRIKSSARVDSDSSDEFIDSDDSNSSTNTKNNVAILVGPTGCGKTCAVYMLANELGFKVLEVNAGSNRTGKRIIDELLEATQSHRVKRISDSNKEVKKVRKKNESKHNKKTMSLILIEDADILFENYDEGFLSALNSLASLSKRPLIFTVNNLNYPHLNKYNNSLNLILHFDYPSRSSINVWLKLIALTEGLKLTDELLAELFKVAGNDVRKNLLQLQILISSKYYPQKFDGEQLFHQDWLSHVTLFGEKKLKKTEKLDAHCCDKVFSDDEDFPELKISEETDEEKLIEHKNRRDNINCLLKISKFYDSAANLNKYAVNSVFHDISSPFYCREDNSAAQLSNDISDFLRNELFFDFTKANPQFSFKKYYNDAMQNSRIRSTTENVFMHFNPKITSKDVKFNEYLPFIRQIARIERDKCSIGYKRTNRYFGYLKSVNIDVSDKETNLLCSTLV